MESERHPERIIAFPSLFTRGPISPRGSVGGDGTLGMRYLARLNGAERRRVSNFNIQDDKYRRLRWRELTAHAPLQTETHTWKKTQVAASARPHGGTLQPKEGNKQLVKDAINFLLFARTLVKVSPTDGISTCLLMTRLAHLTKEFHAFYQASDAKKSCNYTGKTDSFRR